MGYSLAASNEIQVAMSVVMVGLPCTSTDLGNGQIDSEWQRRVDQVLLQPLNPCTNSESLDWFKGKSTGNHGFYHQI
jgi:hypothetical protein